MPDLSPLNTPSAEPVCSCCGSTRFSGSMGANYPWRYLRCEDCGGVQLHPVPTEAQLEQFYNFAYKVEVQRHHRQMATVGGKMLDLLESKTSGRRLLEIGCAYGGFLRLAQSRGWSSVGIEASASAALEASSNGLEVYGGTLQVNLPSLVAREFDVIALWHVIEHFPDARQVLRPLFRLLAPGGYLAFRTPNAESIGARLLRRRWEWFYAPEHIFLYTAQGIRRLLEEFGLEVQAVSSQRGDAHTLLTQTVTAFGSFAIGQWRDALGKKRSALDKRPMGLRAAHQRVSSITNVLGKPIDSLMGLDGQGMRGSELVILARKP